MDARQNGYFPSYLDHFYPHQLLLSDDYSNVNDETNGAFNHHYLTSIRSQPRQRNMQRILNTNEPSTTSLVDLVREKNFQSQHVNRITSYQPSAFSQVTEDENLRKPLGLNVKDLILFNTEYDELPIYKQLAQLSVSASAGDDTSTDRSFDPFACSKLECNSVWQNSSCINNGQLDSSFPNSFNPNSTNNYSDTDWAHFVAPTNPMTSFNTDKKKNEYSFFSDSSSVSSSNGSLNGTNTNRVKANEVRDESSNPQPSHASSSYANSGWSPSQVDKRMEAINNCISSLSQEQLKQIMKMVHDTFVQNQLCASSASCTQAARTEMPKPVNAQAYSYIRNGEVSCENSFSSPNSQESRIPSYLIKKNEINMLDLEARNHHTAAIRHGNVKAATVWNGEIPHLSYSTSFSNKVFVGGLPYQINENQLVSTFGVFGNLVVHWPGKENRQRFKGFVYIIYENEQQVQLLLKSCRERAGNLFFTVSLRNGKMKDVQIIPWSIVDSYYPSTFNPFVKYDTDRTLYVGALHGTMSAQALFKIMDDLFGGVIHAGISVDKYKYPTGSGRVVFDNCDSYAKAISAGFANIKTPNFEKTVNVYKIIIGNIDSRVRSKKVWTGLTREKSVERSVQFDPFMEDKQCRICRIKLGPYFCREECCFSYFCSECYTNYHKQFRLEHHRPLKKNSKCNRSGFNNTMNSF